MSQKESAHCDMIELYSLFFSGFFCILSLFFQSLPLGIQTPLLEAEKAEGGRVISYCERERKPLREACESLVVKP